VGLAVARLEHRHRRFVGMHNLVAEHRLLERIDQRLQLHPTGAYPRTQRGARNRVAGTREDRLLAVQRQMIGELRHHDLGQQPCGGNAFVDDVCRHRRLGERLAFGADPFAADMSLHREHARLIGELLRDVFADARKRAATAAAF
jgi:hypothetical protein